MSSEASTRELSSSGAYQAVECVRANSQSGWSRHAATLHRPDKAELPSSPHQVLTCQPLLLSISHAFQCKSCCRMAEELETHLAIWGDVDDHPTRSLSPWTLMENKNSGSSSGAAHARDIDNSLSNEELIPNDTDRALRPSALEDIDFTEYMLRADTVIPEINQSVSLSSNLRLRRSSEKHRLHSRIR